MCLAFWWYLNWSESTRNNQILVRAKKWQHSWILDKMQGRAQAKASVPLISNFSKFFSNVFCFCLFNSQQYLWYRKGNTGWARNYQESWNIQGRWNNVNREKVQLKNGNDCKCAPDSERAGTGSRKSLGNQKVIRWDKCGHESRNAEECVRTSNSVMYLQNYMS